MPGLVGVITNTKQSTAPVFSKMLNRLSAVQEMRSERVLAEEGSLSIGAKILLKTRFETIRSGDDQIVVFLKGDLYNATIEEILEKYEREGISCFKESLLLDGSFSGGIVDKAKRKLFLFTDPVGLDPLYYCHGNGWLGFSSEIKSLLEIPNFRKDVDGETLLDLWTYGFVSGNKTPFKQAQLLAAGTILSLDFATFEISFITYCAIIDWFADSFHHSSTLEEVSGAFSRAVECRSNDFQKTRLGLSLSGGLDSRAILGGLGERARGFVSYTLGLPGCADERLAQKMALLLGTAHTFVPITDSDLKDFESLASMMITLSDGLYHPHESTEQVAMDYLARQPFEAMLRGHGGEIAKASLAYPFQASYGLALSSSEETLGRLWNTASLGKRDIAFGSIFCGKILDSYNDKQEPFQEELKMLRDAHISNFDMCIYFYITQWIRRQVVASLSIFRNQVDIRLPYLDRKFLTLLLKLPIEERWNGEFHKHFIKNVCPKLVAIPDSNTGAPLNAGRVRVLLTSKFNGLLKKLRVSGFRHYTDFQRWQREQFKVTTENILLSDRTLDRNYYQPDQLKKIIALHNEGEKNYAHFLGTAVGIELWHRNFFDK